MIPIPWRNSSRDRGVRRRSMAGATAVECAFVLPACLLIVLAGLDYGLLNVRHSALSQSARSLARQTIVHGSESAPDRTPWGPASYLGDASEATDIAAMVRQHLISMDAADVQIQVEWIDDDNEPDDRIHVTLSYDHHPIVPFLSVSETIPLRGSTIMRILN